MKTILTILCIGITSFCNAQFLDKLGDRAADAVERTVERRVEKETTKSTDRVLDTIVDAPKKEKKEKKKSKKKSSGKNIIGGDPVDDNSNASSTQNSDATKRSEDEG
ncbi:hypothetical protein [Aequorivita antarctica]|uniref:Uncharacterized protein n=1 Tax=Aequorivita antarctica TaxID=153266 RepID=A0A5C6Z166_9FLAO|nr:hypothetical protein [Aequorivita antarctica]TXD73804.1 hypothetical protein ESU54_04860 [Aequorivita antarctica]SRX73483.1 hypothetical protein AEQU3_00921 [Aequorivita antarctica]